MANKPKNHSITPDETSLVIAGLRRYALQLDTKVKYAEDEDEAEGFVQDIADIRTLLGKLGDTKALVLKSERKPKAKKTAKPKAKSVKITKAKAKAIEATAEALAEFVA
jgi:hypothetical protein